MSSALLSPQIAELSTTIEEATRSTAEGVKFFVEPAEGALRRATSRRHHMVFGRRGSGKSSLLRKAAADLTVDRRPIAWVDLEPFKGHSYPDLLLSVLIAALRSFQKWLQTAAIEPANKTSFWKRLFDKKPTRSPHNRAATEQLVARIVAELQVLEEQLHSSDHASIEVRRSSTSARQATDSGSGSVSVPHVMSAETRTESTARSEAGEEHSEQYRRSKVEFLRRHIMDYQAIFDDLAALSGGDGYLFLDDLYHIRKDDQAQVVDYFHAIGKGHNLWLKIGTIRHRTQWYVHSEPPIGVKLGDDADEINLDLTLEKYALTKDFLVRVLENLSQVACLKPSDFLTSGAVDRLVLASGGVARDFLGILRRSIDIARERQVGDRRQLIDAEDINVAAGEYDSSKREEFKRDTYTDDEAPLDTVFNSVRDFCLEETKSNCFLIDQDARGPTVDALNELVDLKLLHRIRSRVTVNTLTQRGKLFEAYMLDLSQYAGARKRRGLEMTEFWKPESQNDLRRASLIYKVSDPV